MKLKIYEECRICKYFILNIDKKCFLNGTHEFKFILIISRSLETNCKKEFLEYEGHYFIRIWRKDKFIQKLHINVLRCLRWKTFRQGKPQVGNIS